MRKSVILGLLLTIIATPGFSQWKVGAHFGATGTDEYLNNFGIDAYYMFRNPDAFFKYGFNAGFSVFPGNEIDINGTPTKLDAYTSIPIAFAIRFTLFRVLTFGPDVGIGLSLSENLGSGLYFKGILGIDIANAVELNLYLSFADTGNEPGDIYPSEFVSAGGGFLIHIY